MHNITKIIVTFLGIYFFSHTSALADDSRLDPLLRLNAKTQNTHLKGLLSAERVTVVVRFKDDIDKIREIGGIIHSVLGDIATIEIPITQLQSLAALPNIIYVEAPRKLQKKLDASVPETGASQLRSGVPPDWSGNTGRNVIIGVIDSGLDLTHKDFKGKDGKTRVLSLWDQNLTGTSPSGFSYGKECTKAVIDSGTCGSTDQVYHGTHVAGIAAGNGSASGSGQGSFRFVGMAPEADLIIVQYKDDGSTSAFLDGIAYIQSKAAAMGRPSVINLSVGEHTGPHDGTSNFERGLDNASGPGKVIVAAASNEGQLPIHASATVAQGGSKIVGLSVPPQTPFVEIHIWYRGQDNLSFKVGDPSSSCVTPLRSAGDPDFEIESSCGYVGISTPATNPNNGDKEILLILGDSVHPLTRGVWSLELDGANVINGRFDMYSNDLLRAPTGEENLFTSNIDYSGTIATPGTATKVITVGSYVTKNSWPSISGFQTELGAIINNISSFSSKGPRRLCSICSPVQKPEIAAPGEMIVSSLSSQSSQVSALIDPDRVHHLLAGTSMATPHVTGAVALLLQAAPTFTSDQLKNILTSNTKVGDAFTSTLPNNTWGFGKLDVKAAFAAIPNPPPAAPSGLSVTAGNASVNLSWAASQELDLEGYYVYRSATSGTGFAKLNSSVIRQPNFNDTGLTNGATFFYRITAVDTKGQQGPQSAEKSGTPASGGGAPAPIPPPISGGSPTTPNDSASSGGGGGGCSMLGSSAFDPMLAGLFGGSLFYLGWKRLKKMAR